MNWRNKAESRLGKLGAFIYRNPKKIIFIVLLISITIITAIPNIKIDTSTEGFLHKQDPTLLRYEAFKKQFGQDEMVMLVVKSETIFELKTITKFKKLHQELEDNMPHLNDITSIINARNTRGVGDTLVVEDLFEHWPENEEDLLKIKKLALNNPLYENLLMSSDLKFAVILVEPSAYEQSQATDDLDGFSDETSNEELEFLHDESKSEMVAFANKMAKKYSDDNFEVFVVGSLAVNDYIKQSLQHDLQLFVKLTLLMMLLFLFVIFRRLSAVVLPLFIVILSLLTTIGIMSISGTPITIPIQILPSFLLAVGIGATVHLLAMFFKNFNEFAVKKDAIVFALEHSGLAIIMTSLTTAAGLLSFMTAEVAPIASLGIFAAIGIIIALLNTIILLPAILSLINFKQVKEKHASKSLVMDKVLIRISTFSLHHAKSIVFISLIIFTVFTYFASQLQFKHDALSWHPDSSQIKQNTFRVDKALKGSVTIEVILDTKKENGLYNAKLLQKIDRLRVKIEQINHGDVFVGKGWSVVEVLKEIHQALHENQKEFYRITDNNALIPQEFLLFENSGSDDLEDLVDASFSKARLTFKLPWMEAGKYTQLNKKIQKMIEKELGDTIEVTVTGIVPLFQRTLVASLHSMGTSYLFAFIMISVMMILLLGSFKVGMLSMIPNILPVIVALGLMKMLSMPLDLFTMLIGAIIIGLSVDDTVHFFHNFAKYRNKGLGVEESLKETMLGAGRAMVATTIVLSLGFYIYTFASMSNMINFGFLTGTAIIVALISDIVLAPALLQLTNKDKK